MMSGMMLKFPRGGLLTQAGRAGPRRLMLLGASAVGLLGLIVVVTSGGRRQVIESQDARMSSVDPLPGGLHSTPEMNALAVKAETQQAGTAMRSGQSYTPALAASVPVQQGLPATDTAPAPAPPQPRVVFHTPAPPLQVVIPQEVAAQPDVVTPPPVKVIPVQATVVDSKAVEGYNKQIGDLFSQWGGRLPRTELVTPASDNPDDPAGTAPTSRTPVASTVRDSAATPVAPSTRAADADSHVLVPAGRGVYAHPILALNSDQASPAIFQADSGPLAGDRMIGSFSREGDRLIIHVNSVIHHGEQINADGVVIAPETMEASVASDVDQHYLTRFILPAAAAFVQGLGQAIATTSNSTAVLSPFGGATTTTNLNFRQQLGVAAGTAGAQIGSVLNQAAPKAATVSLEANVSIGVMFLSNVTSHRS